jgi:hypothetical protein
MVYCHVWQSIPAGVSEIHGHWSFSNINAAFTLAGSYFTPKEHQHFPAATFHPLLK